MMLAVILFTLAAVGGLVMAVIRLSGKPYPPVILPILHGLAAASGLVALAVQVFGGTDTGTAKIALGVFLVAALGGFVLVSFHARRKALPLALVFGHAGIAVTGFILLLKAIM